VQKADIRGRWALVTGASRGIGRQVASGLAGHGCHLLLHSRDLAHTAPLVAELGGQGIDVRPVAGELARPDDVERVIDEALAAAGGIDIAYNNAAVMTPFCSDWLSVPPEDLRASLEVNLVALVRICHRLLPGMIARKWGRVVNVTSGIADQPELIAYAISKAAVDKFVRDSVCRLKGTGVLMNLLDPGWLRTDLGGPDAPGALVPVLIDDGTTGHFFAAQDYVGQTL
jgi:3-oxoacyl-[acyl-carrier protein] reductase